MTQSTGAEAPAEAATDAPTGCPAQPHPTLPDGFGELDRRAIDTARVLAMDAVQKVGNGHPGTAMSMAPTAYLLFQKWLRHDPSDPNWVGRDRFVLSMGHSSLTLYVPALPLRLRPGARRPRGAAHLGLADPGPPRGRPHPRRRDHHRPAGPGRRQRRRHGDGRPPRARPVRPRRRPRARACSTTPSGPSPPTATWRRASAARRPRSPAPSSWATWSSSTTTTRSPSRTTPNIAFTEDVALRYEAYGWHVQRVRRRRGPRRRRRRLRRRQGRDRPPVDHRAEHDHRLARAHQAEHRRRARLGARRGRGQGHQEDPRLRPGEDLRRRPPRSSRTPARSSSAARRRTPPGSSSSTPGQQSNPERRRAARADDAPARCPRAGPTTLPSWRADPKGVATRKASGEVLAALYPELPELWGGSADLAESNNTAVKGEPSFLPADRQTKMWSGGPYGRTLHFGVREHAMGSIMNGIALHGGTRVYGGTFLTFSDYMRGAGAAGRAHAAAGHLRLDPRLDRPRRGRPDPPADRAPRRAAGHPRPGRRPARPTPTRPPSPGGRSSRTTTGRPAWCCRGRTCPSSTAAACSAEGVAKRRLRAGRGLVGHARGDPHRHRLRGADRRRRPRAAGGRRHPDPGRVDALRRVVRRRRTTPTAARCSRRRSARGSASRPGCRWAGANSWATPAGSSASTTTAPAPRTACCTRSSA